ncbi:3-phosphoglycerate dehydrogenase [Robiginitalea sp.]|nr:3-phosphoglycerate dehydrogenase [Robiginitalea sp.]
MKKILANDGIATTGKNKLEVSGFEVITTNVAQNQLIEYINSHQINVLIVRSATRVEQELINACPTLEIIGRIGTGVDNIAVDYAIKKGLKVLNTPGAGAQSVAELTMAHLLGGSRLMHESNRIMPLEGDQQFKSLKKQYAVGHEVHGKTLGILGMGNIGKAVARMGASLGLEICYHDPHCEEVHIPISFNQGNQSITLSFRSKPLEEILASSDFISLHLPAQSETVIGKRELGIMKPGSALINTARGGLVDEVALLEALDSGHLRFAALDVYESEPYPEIQLLMRPELSLTPHIGGSTPEAQERASLELARSIIEHLSAVI